MGKDRENDLTQLLIKLQDEGVAYAYCYYAGGGDSGAIEEVYAFDNTYAGFFDVGDLDVSHNTTGGTFYADYELSSGEDSILEDFFLTKLNDVEDWWNNDGGYGYMAIRLSDLEFKINNNCYYTQTEAYDHGGKMDIR